MAVFTEHFAPRFRPIAPDLRGYGRSPRTGPFVMTDHLDDLERLLDQLGVDRCLVLGWSLGGILALSLALRDLDRGSDRIAGLILVATAARPWGDHPPITWLDLVYTVLAGSLNHLFPGQPWIIETLGRRSLLRYLIQQHEPKTYRYLAQSALIDVWQTSGAANRALQAAAQAGFDRLADCARLRLPCLVLAGAADRHICAAASQATAQALPEATWHCYADTAHLFPWEKPEAVLADIDRWLNEYNFNPDHVGNPDYVG